jgi:pseudouridylate synthase I
MRVIKRNIKLVLSYDGSDLAGWQRQDKDRSAQGELEAALARMHGHPVPTIGAGRTDSGVHAMGQVANFYTDIQRIPPERFLPALNRLLPRDVRVLSAAEADFDFHSRYDARLRRYRYFVSCGRSIDPVRLRYSHQLFGRPSVAALNAAAACILGETDFTTFSAAKDLSASRSRYVHESAWRWEGGQLVYQVAANAFLWRMVRSLVGSMLHFEGQARAALGETASEAELAAETGRLMAQALAAEDRGQAGPTAPARGLFLWNVEYYSSPTRPGRGDYWCAGKKSDETLGADGEGE